MKKDELIPISASTFYEGMHIGSEIFFNYKKNYILLCRDVTLNSDLIAKLRQSELMSHALFVNRENMDEIVEQSKIFKQQEQESEGTEPMIAKKAKPKQAAMSSIGHLNDLQAKIKLHGEYNDLTAKASNMLDIVTQADTVPAEICKNITRSVSEKIEFTDPSVLIQCINSLRKMNEYLYIHSANVAMINGLIGKWIGLPPLENELLIRTGLLHDLGKTKIPQNILDKPARLTNEEYEIVKKHAIYSYECAKNSGETDERVLGGIKWHHERMNGSGYPDGLKADEIPLFARITATSDVYDAMVAKRPYKDRNSPFEILHQFATSRFSDLDIGIVNIFLSNMTNELLGKKVILSDGRTARVAYINPSNFAYPMVKIGKNFLITSPAVKCVAMENFLSLTN